MGQEDNNENIREDVRPDNRRWQAQDNEGHLPGSRQAGNSRESMNEEREKDANDNSALNQLDDRGVVGGNETS